MSSSVVVGFTAALGMLIFASQLGNFLGIVSAPRVSPSWCSERSGTWPKPSRGWFSWRPRHLRSRALATRLPKIPPMLTAMVLGSITPSCSNQALGAERTGLRTLGPLPGALPPLSFPDVSAATLQSLLPAAIAVALCR